MQTREQWAREAGEDFSPSTPEEISAYAVSERDRLLGLFIHHELSHPLPEAGTRREYLPRQIGEESGRWVERTANLGDWLFDCLDRGDRMDRVLSLIVNQAICGNNAARGLLVEVCTDFGDEMAERVEA